MTLRVTSLESIKLALSSYGPFDELELNLTPLTIITGPNAVGKSFLMRAVYAMLAPCRDGSPDVGAVVSRLCNSSVCDEPRCLNRVLRRGSQTLELRLEAWGYRRGLRYDAKTGTIELLRADCFPIESILVPGYRAYLTLLPYFYRFIGKPIPEPHHFNSPVYAIATLAEPMAQRLVPEIGVEETSGVKLGEVVSRFNEIVEEMFPEVEHLGISLPGISKTPSNMPLLPASILHSYPLIVAIAYAETLSQKGVRTVLIIEEPELGLDFRRQRLLAQHLVSAVKKAKGTLMAILSTHSIEMLISLTKEVAGRRMRKHAKVCEVVDGRVRRESIGGTGRVYVKHMFEELAEIYGDM
jgi:hypothetical protein